MKPHRIPAPTLLALLALTPACHLGGTPQTPPEAVSLLGEPLYRPEIQPEQRAQLEAELAAARATYEHHPGSEDAAVWVGRRLAYLGRYRDAVSVYSEAMERHPWSVKLPRHRGHRYVTLRDLPPATDDLTRAWVRMQHDPDEVEPDGQPNALGVPTSTTKTNVHYHLALAHYLRGGTAFAELHWRACAELATNDDMRVAARYWQVLCLARLGLHDEARAVLAGIGPDMDVIENRDYHRLLLHFAGRLSEKELLLPAERGTVSFPTTWYGLGAWKLAHGDEDRARAIFEVLLDEGFWPAFGHIAAEAELARMRG